jgi:hypothetical protein
MRSSAIGIPVFLVIFGCSANRSPREGEKQEIKLKQEKICILAAENVDAPFWEKLSTDLEKTFG